MRLNVLTKPPAGLFDLAADELLATLKGPTLIHVPGAMTPPLFLSVLLHGNETSGWQAVSRLLRTAGELPRSIVLFIGNVEAAAAGVRTLPTQPDYNRIWREYAGPEGTFARDLLEQVRLDPPFAALDIHNNTGRNPHYSVLTRLDPASRALAYMFSDKAVFIDEPDTVLSRALHDVCPATTIEVGPVGDPASEERTFALLQDYLQLSDVPVDPTPLLKLHRSIGRVHIVDNAQFDFADEIPQGMELEEDLILTAGVEAVNFHPIPAGFEFGGNANACRTRLAGTGSAT